MKTFSGGAKEGLCSGHRHSDPLSLRGRPDRESGLQDHGGNRTGNVHRLDSRCDFGGDSLSVGEEQDTVGRTTIRSSIWDSTSSSWQRPSRGLRPSIG